jgi:hypothetical protein
MPPIIIPAIAEWIVSCGMSPFQAFSNHHLFFFFEGLFSDLFFGQLLDRHAQPFFLILMNPEHR